MRAVETGLDEFFLVRVYRTSALVWAVGVGLLSGCGMMSAALGWTVGSAASVGLLRGIEWAVRRFFVPGRSFDKRDLAKLASVKFGVIVSFMLGVVLLGGRSFGFIAGFCAGVILSQSVIVFKALGAMISCR
ncbi:MAG: hypothetical protein QHI38_01255 [Armatimonadota bacterium]|nr:hypothetical protein [Armatimonadota bacterium]